MNRKEFLENPDVINFISWLKTKLPSLKLKLNFKASRFVPGGLTTDINGFEEILAQYKWSSSWTHPDGATMKSTNWLETKESLAQLSEWLTTAINNNDETQTLEACLQILKWGGVRGAIPFLSRKYDEKELVTYLRSVEQLMLLDNDETDLNQLNEISIQRFDAGLTKIHALLDKTGSPIYDSRVGAAIGMLYSLYCHQNNQAKATLQFPYGKARGDQIRNPKNMPNGLAMNVCSDLSYAEWAQWQVRLGWIIRDILESTDWFTDEGEIAARCRAFEACLFVIGYDLRCFELGKTNNLSEEIEHTTPSRGTTWVPTSHSFSKIINDYLEFRQMSSSDNKAAFTTWLVDKKNVKPTTAVSYLFPFPIQEFDLFERPLKDIERIAAGGEDGLLAALSIDKLEPFTLGDEREKVCLVDVFITGEGYKNYATESDRVNSIMQAGYAGTNSSANTLMTVGRNVGRHFGLLDANSNTTELFERFFEEFSLED